MKNAAPSSAVRQPVPLVAIGATADGIEAVKDLLTNLPGATGMAYLYLQGTSGDTAVGLVETLSRQLPLPIALAEENLPLKADTVYLLPANTALKVSGQTLVQGGGNGNGDGELHINRFFSSLTEAGANVAIGVVLSAVDNDGLIGLKAIKTAGGITFMAPDVLRNGQPSGTVTTAADFVMSPKEMAGEIRRLSEQKALFYPAADDLAEGDISDRDENLLSILWMLNRATGVDFGQYKMNTIKRRIIRRMMLFQQASLKDYVAYLRQHTQETALLYQDLLINVTNFFRDAEATEFIKTTLLPQLLKTKLPTDTIRVWVPACSTGQEPYSLAMLMVEVVGEQTAAQRVQLFATDLSEAAVNKARVGLYSKDEVAGLSPERLQRFFTRMDGHYRISKGIRDLCIFATHNVAKDPPFSRLDIISCCNLLIYLNLPLQTKLMATFHYSLTTNGFLVLGKSETVGSSSYLFGQVEKRFKIYSKKKDTSAKAMFEMNFRVPDQDNSAIIGRRPSAAQKKPDEMDLEKAVDFMLLKRFTPASVLVNADLDILQFRGSTGLYLEPSPGKASLNLLKMARPGLGFELRNVVHKAKKNNAAAKKDGVEITIDGKVHVLCLEALPLKGDGDEDYFLVVFEAAVPLPETVTASSARNGRVQQLEAELTALREDMRSIVESQEAANEELQSANEEIVSSNEELQSINEELETSKEEIESSNEELITMNQELQIRNDQLAEAQEYGEAVFTTIREGLLILDKDLRVKTANNAFYKMFSLREGQTEGRLLYDLADHQWNIPRLRQLLEDIIPENTQFQGYEIQHSFAGVGEKFLMLNARRLVQRSHAQQLILLAIEDMTLHRIAEQIVTDKQKWLRSLADDAPAMIWTASADGACTFVNQSYLDYRGLTQEEVMGRAWYAGTHPDEIEAAAKIYTDSWQERKPFEFLQRIHRRDGTYHPVITRAKPNFTSDEIFSGYIGSCMEVPSGH